MEEGSGAGSSILLYKDFHGDSLTTAPSDPALPFDRGFSGSCATGAAHE